MDTDGIDLAVLYPTSMLGLQSVADEDFARVQARAYNDWASDHTQEGEGRLFAAGAVPPMNDEDGVAAVAAEIRRVAEKPGMVSVFLRPNPSVDWRPFNDKIYDPVWQAAAETGLVLAFHPFLMPDLPGACRGLKLARPFVDGSYAPSEQEPAGGWEMSNILFTQAIANPVDVMHSIAYVTAGGVCERFPDTKFLFLEANGGWLVPWLERLDHHSKKFEWDVPWLEDAAVGVLPPSVLDQLRPRRVDAGVHRELSVVRRRPDRVGVGLPTPRRQVPGRHRGARRSARAAQLRAAERDHQRERAGVVRHWLTRASRAAT